MKGLEAAGSEWCGGGGGRGMGNRGACNDHLRGRIFSEQSWV